MSYGNVRITSGHSAFQYRKKAGTGLPYFFVPKYSKRMLLDGTGFELAAILRDICNMLLLKN